MMYPWKSYDETERALIVIAVCGVILLCLWALFG